MKKNHAKTQDQIGGGKPGPGRPKGIPNKLTGDVKAMILEALASAGGADYLARQAEQSPAAFMSLVGKVLPMTVQGGDNGEPIQLVVVFPKRDGHEAD